MFLVAMSMILTHSRELTREHRRAQRAAYHETRLHRVMKAVFRSVAGTIGLFALGLQYWLMTRYPDARSSLTTFTRFFSYFTILTNTLIVLSMFLPLIGRNGAHALLECARRMEGAIELVIAGRVADDPCAVRAYAGLFRCAPEAPLGWADVVVAPHLIDGYSREVERALARRIPVVATEAAGIDMQMPGVIAVSPGSGYEIARTLEALRHPVARGRLRADLAALAELRSPRRTAELLKIWVT